MCILLKFACEGGMISNATVFITAAVTIALWIGSRLVEYMSARNTRARERIRYLTALYAEIDFNTHDMEEFVEESDISHIAQRLRDGLSKTPHITDSRHTQIYRGEIGLVHHVGAGHISSVVNFYGIMEKIKAQIDGTQLASYGSISPAGRAVVVTRIYEACSNCASVGRSLLEEMERSYPSLRLKRRSRNEAPLGLGTHDGKLMLSSLQDRIAAATEKSTILRSGPVQSSE
jgi:hypothetical protein